MASPSTLTEQTADRLTVLLRDGASVREAAEGAGVGYGDTRYRGLHPKS